MKTRDILRLGLCGLAVLTLPTHTLLLQTAPTIVWETTFNCPDWNTRMGLRDEHVCAAGDGIAGWGGWTTANGNADSILGAANYPGGGGGKGFRHMQGDGRNNNGGGIRITFPGLMKDVWVRWYMRRMAGFRWANDQPHYTKDLYFNDTILTEPVFVMGFSSGLYGVNVVRPGSYHMNSASKGSWQQMMGGNAGDGKWHAFEVHVKMDTNGSNGVAETWVDGVQIHRHTSVNWGGTTGGNGWSFFSMGINQNEPTNNGVDAYTDFDDVAISGSGYIGPIGSTTQQGPAAPANLRITP